MRGFRKTGKHGIFFRIFIRSLIVFFLFAAVTFGAVAFQNYYAVKEEQQRLATTGDSVRKMQLALAEFFYQNPDRVNVDYSVHNGADFDAVQNALRAYSEFSVPSLYATSAILNQQGLEKARTLDCLQLTNDGETYRNLYLQDCLSKEELAALAAAFDPAGGALTGSVTVYGTAEGVRPVSIDLSQEPGKGQKNGTAKKLLEKSFDAAPEGTETETFQKAVLAPVQYEPPIYQFFAQHYLTQVPVYTDAEGRLWSVTLRADAYPAMETIQRLLKPALIVLCAGIAFLLLLTFWLNYLFKLQGSDDDPPGAFLEEEAGSARRFKRVRHTVPVRPVYEAEPEEEALEPVDLMEQRNTDAGLEAPPLVRSSNGSMEHRAPHEISEEDLLSEDSAAGISRKKR